VLPDPEAPEADALEQSLPVGEEEPVEVPSRLDGVPEADALEQAYPVDLDEDAYRA
jgi:hypothetical protein